VVERRAVSPLASSAAARIAQRARRCEETERAQAIHPFAWTPVQSRRGGQGAGQFSIREEPGVPGRARVSGSLTGEAGPVLLAAVASGVVLLDLSGVHRIDDATARVLAGLQPDRCTLLGCPRWLVLSMARLRRTGAEIAASHGDHEMGPLASVNSTTTERAPAR
jgi:hypothetical protein